MPKSEATPDHFPPPNHPTYNSQSSNIALAQRSALQRASRHPLCQNRRPMATISPLPTTPLTTRKAQAEIRHNGRRSNALPVIRYGPLGREPVLTWNGKRGVVLDIACMWICSACTSGSVSALGSKRGSEESPNRLQEIANKPQQALGLAGICRDPY